MKQPDRPNILLLFTDQQSADMMSCAGNPWLGTPAMDSLAEAGMRFERAYCTNPVCVPSRFSLMTGRMPSAIGLRTNDSSHIGVVPGRVFRGGMGWLMRSAGYEAAYGGKVHLPCGITPEDLGFEVITKDQRDGLADACVEFLQTPRKKPFCLVASFINPHDICYMAIRDYGQSERRRKMLARATKELAALDEALQRPDGVTPVGFFTEYCPPLPPNAEPMEDEPQAVRENVAASDFRGKARDEWSDERWREHRWAYCRLTERVDAQVGRVLKALRQSGLDENTVVVFTSDHGDYDGAHRLEHKGLHYEEACRIPLIVVDPRKSRLGVVDDKHLVSNGLDLLPTFCDYAGISPPQDLEGVSLHPLVHGQTSPEWRESLPVEYSLGRLLVTERYKYALYDEGAHRELLIDRLEDPGEMCNVAGDPDKQPVLTSLQRLFQSSLANAVHGGEANMRA